MKLYYVIVIYNKECAESITIKNLVKYNEKNIIIVDNSSNKNNNKNFCVINNMKYINMNGNKGISKAYNAALKTLNNKNGYIMWLDDDTDITSTYIYEVKKMMGIYDLVIPIVRYKNKIISPLKKTIMKYKSIENAKYSNYKNIYAINSCLTVNIDVYKNYIYNEKLFLDNIDIDFFREVVDKNNFKIKILDTKIQQNLFLIENCNIEKFKTRYLLYIRDNYIFHSTKFERKILFFKVIYWSIKYSIKYKNITLITYIIKKYFETINLEE